ncbi:hypothetical protein Tco_0668614, partial [Tanacetum coccineum]
DEEDDKRIDIQEIDYERTEFDNDDVEMEDVTKTNADKAEEEENVEKAEEEKKEEELKGDDQAKNEQEVGPVSVTHKDKPDLLLSTSSHSVSSNFGNQFLNISSNVSLIGTIDENANVEITSLMDIEIQHVVPNIQQDPVHEVLVLVISTPATLLTTPPIITPSPATTTKALIPLSFESKTLTSVLQRLSIEDMEKAKTVELPTQKKIRHDDKDQDPPAGPDQGLKKRKISKDVEPSKRPKSTGSSKGTTKSQPKSTGKSIQVEEIVFEAADTNMPLNQGDDKGNTNEQLDVQAVTKDDWFKNPSRPLTLDPEWNTRKSVDDGPEQNWLNDLANVGKPPLTFDDLMSTPIDFSAFAMNRLKIRKLTKADLVGLNYPEGNRCPYDLSKPLPLQECQGHLTVPIDFFFKNDLEYLRKGSTDRKYMASTTKTKAEKYEIEGIEDMVPKVSRHDVYLTIKILSVTSVTIYKWYEYGHLKEIVVRRADQKLYKFIEGDFPRLHLNDIEDMLLLVVQNRLNNLEGDKKLNISKPQTHDVEISFKELYITHSEPSGFIYEDKLKRKRLMRTNKLYKFSDGTLDSVCNTLWQMLMNFHLGYNKAMKRRKWTVTYKKRTRIMIKAIDQQLLERRIMRSLEKFVGGYLLPLVVNGDAPAIASVSAGTEGPIPPKTAEQH